MTRVEITLPDETFAGLDRDSAQLAADLRAAAAAKWYEVGRVSQEVAAQIAGVSRSEFLNILSEFKVSPMQETHEEALAGSEFAASAVRAAVLNASPVIVLARAGYLDLVPKLVSSPMIPRAVATEIRAGEADDPAAKFLAQPSWLTIVDLNPALSPLAIWRLGQGESEVLEYARRNPGTVAILDDRAARRSANALKIPIVGTLGLLLAAKRSGLIESIENAIERVKGSGLFIDPATASKVIAMAP